MQLEPIAVVGLGAVLPGAFSLDQFWSNLKECKDAHRVVPSHRWVLPSEEAWDPSGGPDHVFSQRGCYLDDFRLDPAGLNLPNHLLEQLDPLYHLALQAGREAWLDCRHQPIDPTQVGVILASIALPTDGSSTLTWNRYQERLAAACGVSGQATRRPSHPRNRQVTGLPAGLLARALGLGGGTYTLDAACASSLYAIKLACDELWSGRAQAMLAGGVSRPDCLYTQMGFTALGALSPSGRCSPFDASADGLVVGEGAGVLALKRLSQAEAHGDRIYGLLCGFGLSNDIGGSLLAPDTEGQLRAMHGAYARAGWSPTEVQLVECHGTGTPTGDRIEVGSLIRLWEGLAYEPGQCAIGSVKSMIGHLLTGAGAAGMIKVLLGMQHETLPPSLNFRTPNPSIPWAGSPFRVPTQPEPWKARGSRKAAVSAFGFGGVNAHVLVEEYRLQRRSFPVAPSPSPEPIAVLAMAAQVGSCQNLEQWLQSVLLGQSLIVEAPAQRWNGEPPSQPGAFIDSFDMQVGAFKIPPNEMPEVLPQQTLMLRVVAQAAEAAGLDRKQRRPKAGTIIGISLDMDTTNFHLRWALPEALRQWRPDLSASEYEARLAELRDLASAPLDSTRTMGALGSIVASRIARELNLGGPSFAISAEEASGLKALEVGLRALQQGELETVLVAAIDLQGDPRSQENLPLAQGPSRPFEADSQGARLGEGAVALVLKRLADCTPEDRVQAIIRGYGSASGGAALDPAPSPEAQALAIYRAHQEAGTRPDQVSYLEAFGSGTTECDQAELAVLQAWYGPGNNPCALGCLTSQSGLTGACSGLLSLVKAAGALSTRQIPPLSHFQEPLGDLSQGRLHIPRAPGYWFRNQEEGPRRAAVHCLASEGSAVHVLLEEASFQPELASPLPAAGLFPVFDDGSSLAAFLRSQSQGLDRAARSWWHKHRGQKARAYLVLESPAQLEQVLPHLPALLQGPGQGQGGLYFSRNPLGSSGGVAFLYPGSGNHYAGMGRELGQLHPQLMESIDAESPRLLDYFAAPWTVPYRSHWPSDWSDQSRLAIASDLHRSIFGQVMFGLLGSDILRHYGLQPGYAIGYSLGESASLMSLRAWSRRQEIHARMEASDLFRQQLGGPCLAARRLWNLNDQDSFEWRAAVLTAPAMAVQKELQGKLELLIVNTDQECVVGGDAPDLERLIRRLGCQAFYLEAVPTVHSRAVQYVEQAYYDLHNVTTSAPPGIRFYSAYRGQAYEMNAHNSARSIVEQALYGLDFPKVIRQAYEDGARYFVEIGPGNSCTRMVSSILAQQPHRALALNAPQRSEWAGLLHLWAGLLAEGCPGVQLDALYPALPEIPPLSGRQLLLRPGSKLPKVSALPQPLPEEHPPEPQPSGSPETWQPEVVWEAQENLSLQLYGADSEIEIELPGWGETIVEMGPLALMEKQRVKLPALQSQILAAAQATARAHETFLELHQQGLQQLAQGIAWQNQMLAGTAVPSPLPIAISSPPPSSSFYPFCDHNLEPIVPVHKPCWLDYHQCMEFAIGSIGKVLGPEFAPIDAHPTRVRLPDDPLMLVHRITQVEGTPRSLGSGRLVTEHDVMPGAWYLDNQRMPVCVTVEAGQADLFLSGYLGIDFETRGHRVYRLLDATVSFHRRLPTVGETIVYDIRIDRFVRQGDTWLFFFEFDGTIEGQPLITMRNGCAGFFTYEEVFNSKGILLTPEEEQPRPGKVVGYQPLVAFEHTESYSDAQVNALRIGDLAGCFGATFAQLGLTHPPHLPSGRMKLYDRILEVSPRGGRFGLGRVIAEADVHPDDWFLTCHFCDDMVMPGTLMYECCAHTLRFLLWRMGWVGEADQVTYEPTLGKPAALRCRGPVDVRTKKVAYEVELKEIGYSAEGEPYVVADALMYADGKCIVRFVDMSLRLVGLTRGQLEQRWGQKAVPPEPAPLYDRESIMQFAYGKPSLAFGDKYQVFDQQRKIARLPRPPYAFMDRVVEVNQEPWVLQSGDWIEAHYFVPPGEWYFGSNRQPTMAFAILLEIALQPCGWLAAYCGSALRSQEDLKFRNLGGSAVLHREIDDQAGWLRMRVRMTRVSEAGGMIIENFDMQVLQGQTMIYEGTTYFGFFTKAALANQVGIREAKRYQPTPAEVQRASRIPLPRMHPLTPEDPQIDPGPSASMPGGALQMLDEIDIYVADGGPQGLGYLHGIKQVNPEEWFFQAHFFEDPVWPGSLGLEAFLQLLKAHMLQRYPEKASSHRFECIATGLEHTWGYRGQVIPSNRQVEVEAWVTRIEDGPEPLVVADGFLVVDGKPIYEMKDFPLRMVRA